MSVHEPLRAEREAARRRRTARGRRALAVVVAGAAAWAGWWPLVAVALAVVLWPSSAGRWAAGAAGERATARALEGVGRDGWTVFPDVRLGGRRWNLDHVLVGPPGVVVVETKQWRRPVRTYRRHPRIVEERVGWQCDAVAAALGTDLVRPYLCVHGATVRRWRRWAPIGDGRHLRRWLRRLPPALGRREVDDLARRARAVFE